MHRHHQFQNHGRRSSPQMWQAPLGSKGRLILLTGTAAAFLAGCGASSDNLGPTGVFQSPLAPNASQAGAKPESTGPVASIDTSSFVTTGDAGRKAPASKSQTLGAAPSAGTPGLPTSLASLTQAQKPSSKAYLIGSDDTLEITVFKVPELTKVAQVNDAGLVSFPLIGDVVASGRTSTELERDLAQKLGTKYLQNPQVTVTIKEYNSQRVLVDGAFNKPGVYPIRGQATLLQYVANSGGLTPNAESFVVIFRSIDGKQMAARFNVDDIRAGKDPDPEVKSGDVIVASTSAFKEGLDRVLKVLPAVGTFAQVATVL